MHRVNTPITDTVLNISLVENEFDANLLIIRNKITNLKTIIIL